MIVHRICFRFDGQLSEIGAMDVGYVERAMTGARLLLSSHAHFLTTGKVPTQLIGTTELFRIVSIAPARATVDLQFMLAMKHIAEQARLQLDDDGNGALPAEIAAAMSLDLLSGNIDAGLSKLSTKRNLWFKQPLPSSEEAGRLPTSHVERLKAKTEAGLEMIAAPIGRLGGCSHLNIIADGRSLGSIHDRQPAAGRVASPDEYRRIAEEILKERDDSSAHLIV
jgi:hypothetical protein